jgi:drug/metabolite transporter (DMT)-like permease
VDPIVFGLVAVAAVLHVTWNVLLKTAGEPLRAATVGMVAGAIVLIPIGVVGWLLIGRPAISREGIGLGIVSGVIEAAFFSLLSAAYRRGDLSVVYPVARGSATFLAVAAGVLVLGERLGPTGVVGVACLLGGFLWLQRPWRVFGIDGGRGVDPAVGFAFATGVAIASYSAVDRVGTRLIEPWLYAGIMWTTTATILSSWWLVRRVRARPDDRTTDPMTARAIARASVGGLLTVGAYLCILVAFTLAPLTAVAPLRESAIVLASGWGALRLKEAEGRREAVRRIGAAALIVAGAILLGLEG